MSFDLTQVSLTSVITIIGSTGVLSAICTHLFGMFRDWRKEEKEKKKAASYAALRLAVIMEAYALDCAECSADVQTNHSSNGCAGMLHYPLPPIGQYPDDVDWKSLKLSYSTDLLSFPNEVAHYNTIIHGANEFGDPDADGSFECGGYCAVQGLKAWNIAVALRKEYGIEPFIFSDGMWNIEEDLKSYQDRFHERLQAMSDENARVCVELSKLHSGTNGKDL